MPYQLTTFDGSKAFTIADLSIDSQTPYSIIGRGAVGYGQAIAQNTIYLLENFANTSSTSLNALNPLRGQLWFDTSVSMLRINTAPNGNTPNWVLVGGNVVSSVSTVQPATPSTGNVYFNTTTNQLNIWNGSNFLQVGPIFSNASANTLQFFGATSGNAPNMAAVGTDINVSIQITPQGSGAVLLEGPSTTTGTLTVGNNLANYITIAGAVSSSSPVFTATGSDGNVNLTFVTKGTGTIFFNGGNTPQAAIATTAAAVNYLQFAGSTTGNAVTATAAGTDSNISINIVPKGNGTVLFAGTGLAITGGGTGAVNAATARSNLGLGTISTQAATAVAIAGGTLSGVTISGSSLAATTLSGSTATPFATLASATTTDLGTAAGNNVQVSGITTITSLGSSASTNYPLYFLTFTGALILTYNATSLILPGSANITTSAGDSAIFDYLGSGNWRCLHYNLANLNPIVQTNVIGQCRLKYTSSTLLTLTPLNGSWITIQGTPYKIPSAGVTVANGSLSSSTVYYVYAFMSTGVMTLEAVVTTHATDTITGVEIKSGDNSRTLVGQIVTNSSSQFQMNAGFIGVLSWFSRRDIASTLILGSNQNSTSTLYLDISTTLDTTFICWADEVVASTGSGSASNSTGGAGCYTSLSVDDNVNFYPATGASIVLATSSTANNVEGFNTVLVANESEGASHVTRLVGAVTSNTGQWWASAGLTVVTVRTRG